MLLALATGREKEMAIRGALGAGRSHLIRQLLFGLTPALQAARRSVVDSLKDSGKGVSGGFRGNWLRNGLAACYFPARKATRVDPLVALRLP